MKLNVKTVIASCACALASCALFALPMYEKGDPIDLGFPILTALEATERAAICHEGDGRDVRNRILRLLSALDFSSKGYDALVNFPDGLLAGIDTKGPFGFDTIHLAHARLLQMSGKLYDFPAFVSKGRKLEERVRMRRHWGCCRKLTKRRWTS